tara:strand:- start:21289 stop:21438 length:150 start_codon:yes stop_codon:yes gene_type:complete
MPKSFVSNSKVIMSVFLCVVLLVVNALQFTSVVSCMFQQARMAFAMPAQ